MFLALAGAATAASIGQKPKQETHAFTSELDYGFVATLPKSAIGSVVDDQENSLEPQPIIKPDPAVVAQETHIPVTVVQEPVQQDSKKPEAVKVDVVVEKVEPKPAVVEIKEENQNVPQQAESKPEDNILSDSKTPDHEDEECDEEKKLKEAAKITLKEEVKEVVNLEQTRQSDLTSSPVLPVVPVAADTQPPNLIQQGIANLQQGISNIQNFGQAISNTIASIVSPANANPPTQSSPPNLLTNIQTALQNIVRPPSTSSDSGTTPQNGIFQGIQNSIQGIRDGIASMQNTFQSFLNNALGGQNNNNTNNDINRNTTNILEQGIQSLQQGVQNGLQNLNNTIQSVTNPSPDRPGLIQAGIQNLQQGVKNITTGIQNIILPPVSADGSRPGVIQTTVQTLSQGLQQGVQNLNSTIQNIIRPAEASAEAAKPGVENPAEAPATPVTRQTLEQAFLNQLKAINATLEAGVQALTRDLEGMNLDQKVEVAPVGEAVIVDA